MSIHAIRWYEKLGLVEKPTRSEGGYRLYPEKAIKKLLFIKKAQEFGLTLREIKRITVCGEKGLNPCCEMTAKILGKKINEFEGKIKELQHMKKRLSFCLSQWINRKNRKGG